MDIKSVNHYAIYDHTFTNWDSEVRDRWVYDDFINHSDYKKAWVSLTSLVCHVKSNSVYIGIGSFSAELLWRFDRESKAIISCGYENVGEPFDAKFHRSLELDGDTLYAGIALFHDIDKQFVAKGGRLVKYDINTGEYTFLARPVPPAYIQSIALDKKRSCIYGYGALPEVFFSHDLVSGKSKLIAHIGNSCELVQSHNPVIDDRGRVWGTYGILRAFAYRTGDDAIRLFRYDPDHDKMTFFKHGFPRIHPGDKGRLDTMLSGPDGKIYVGTEQGALARLDPDTAEITYLSRPNPDAARLAGLAFHPENGLLYGLCGDDYRVKLFVYDTKTDRLIHTKDVVAADGVRPVRIHHMAFADGNTLYAGENDNNHRSSYLWEIELDA